MGNKKNKRRRRKRKDLLFKARAPSPPSNACLVSSYRPEMTTAEDSAENADLGECGVPAHFAQDTGVASREFQGFNRTGDGTNGVLPQSEYPLNSANQKTHVMQAEVGDPVGRGCDFLPPMPPPPPPPSEAALRYNPFLFQMLDTFDRSVLATVPVHGNMFGPQGIQMPTGVMPPNIPPVESPYSVANVPTFPLGEQQCIQVPLATGTPAVSRASSHEPHITGNAPPSSVDATEVPTTHDCDNSGTVIKYKCDVCLIALFSTYEEALCHEQKCTGRSSFDDVDLAVVTAVRNDTSPADPGSEKLQDAKERGTQPKTTYAACDTLNDAVTAYAGCDQAALLPHLTTTIQPQLTTRTPAVTVATEVPSVDHVHEVSKAGMLQSYTTCGDTTAEFTTSQEALHHEELSTSSPSTADDTDSTFSVAESSSGSSVATAEATQTAEPLVPKVATKPCSILLSRAEDEHLSEQAAAASPPSITVDQPGDAFHGRDPTMAHRSVDRARRTPPNEVDTPARSLETYAICEGNMDSWIGVPLSERPSIARMRQLLDEVGISSNGCCDDTVRRCFERRFSVSFVDQGWQIRNTEAHANFSSGSHGGDHGNILINNLNIDDDKQDHQVSSAVNISGKDMEMTGTSKRLDSGDRADISINKLNLEGTLEQQAASDMNMSCNDKEMTRNSERLDCGDHGDIPINNLNIDGPQDKQVSSAVTMSGDDMETTRTSDRLVCGYHGNIPINNLVIDGPLDQQASSAVDTSGNDMEMTRNSERLDCGDHGDIPINNVNIDGPQDKQASFAVNMIGNDMEMKMTSKRLDSGDHGDIVVNNLNIDGVQDKQVSSALEMSGDDMQMTMTSERLDSGDHGNTVINSLSIDGPQDKEVSSAVNIGGDDMHMTMTSQRLECGDYGDISINNLIVDGPQGQQASSVVNISGNDIEMTRTSKRLASTSQRDKSYGPKYYMTPEDLFERQCYQCVMCWRTDCGKCASCLRNALNPNRQRGVCFRKMCVKICASNKAQPAIGFPDGWTFYFAGDGLVLISPTQTYYRSLESAIQRANLTHGSGSREDLKREFCAHIGEPFDNNCIEQMIVKSRSTSPKKRARPSIHVAKLELSSKKDIGSRVYCKFTNNAYYWGEIVDKRTLMTGIQYAVQFDDGDFLDHVPDTTDDAEEGNIYTEYGYYERVGVYPPKRQSSLPPAKVRKIDIRLTPAELYEKRCKTCSTCTENDCMRCNSCINNRNNRAKVTECCLRKMCRLIQKRLKKQRAPGLPKGWTFASGIGPNVTLISPRGVEYFSSKHALDSCGVQIQDVNASMVEFETYVGGSILWKDDAHFLVGKEYCHEWTDVQSRNKVIYGMITCCERERCCGDYASFTVTYNKESIKSVVRMRTFCGWNIEPTAKMSLDWALGGHLSYLAKHEASVIEEPFRSTPIRQWLTPDMRTEELVYGSDGKKLPRLILVWTSYQLLFTVGPSTIPNAGLGVFVQCTSLVPARTHLRLKKGEMLDLGVYAPFRKEDVKEECVFLVKNFIMGLKCEEWTFDAGPTQVSYQFDITDDWTGELHDLAAQHIPAYVNESNMESLPSVHAEHDPEGVVHYLLGGRTNDLILPADGSKVELFINYGPKYERVRIRKNYSFLPPAQQLSAVKSVHQENAEYLEEIAGFKGSEVTSCMEFVTKIVENGTLPDEFRLNALCVSVALRYRGRMLLIGGNPFLSVEISDVVKQFKTVIDTLLARENDHLLLMLEGYGGGVSLLRELACFVMQDIPREEVLRIVDLFEVV